MPRLSILPIGFMLFLILVSALAGFVEFNLWLFGGDIALLALVLALEPRTRTLMKKRGKKGILEHESPMNWLLGSWRFFLFSLLAAIAYGISSAATSQPLGQTGIPNFDWMFYGAVVFFLSGLLYIARVTEWIWNPDSKVNIYVGRALTIVATQGIRLLPFGMIVFFQLFNGTLLYYDILGAISIHFAVTAIQLVYMVMLVLSFVGAVAVSYFVLFKPREPVRLRQLPWLGVFFAPWIFIVLLVTLSGLGIHL